MPIPAESQGSAARVRLPAERFYWAELDGSGWSGTGMLPEGLLLLLAEELPVPVVSVHAVALSNQNGRVQVCACPRELMQGLDPSVIELKPQRSPDWLPPSSEFEHSNLLIGEFEPPPVRAAKRSRHLLLAGTLVVCSVLASVAMVRRAQSASMAAATAAKAADALVAQETPARRDQALAAKAKAMQSIADTVKRARVPVDATTGLQALLRSWPTHIGAKVQTIAIAGDGISLSVVVDGDPAPLLKGLTVPAGYALDEPRVTSTGPITRLALRLHPALGGSR